MKRKVSIIIPNFNRANLIVETLNSIKQQTYENWECLIIDDHSTDNSVEVINRFIKEDERFKFYKRPSDRPKGANTCRNYGMEVSEGFYIKWFDSDDLMSPNHLHSLVNAICSEGTDFSIGDSINFKDREGYTGKPYCFNRKTEIINADNFAQQRIGWITDDFLGKREILTKIKFNEAFRTDGDEYNFFTQLLHQNRNGCFVNEILSFRRIHEHSLSTKTKPLLENKKIAVIKYLTYIDIIKYKNVNLLVWFLSGYMQYSFKIACQGDWPPFFRSSFLQIFRFYDIKRTIYFFLAILSARFCGKGYFFLRRAIRK